MFCPKCGSKTTVLDSRLSSATKSIRRRRACLTCEHRFTTWEIDALQKALLGEGIKLMATKRELESQIHHHNCQIESLEAMLEDVPKQIEQLKATIELKKKALAEKEQ